MTSALSPEEPVTAICKLNMTNRFPASPPGRRDERWRVGGGGECSGGGAPDRSAFTLPERGAVEGGDGGGD